MFEYLSNNIRSLTLKAADLVASEQIEQCLSVLEKRQALLEKLEATYQESSLNNNNDYSSAFIELIQWVQQQDAPNRSIIMRLKEQSKKDSVTQIHTKKALHHYKNLT